MGTDITVFQVLPATDWSAHRGHDADLLLKITEDQQAQRLLRSYASLRLLSLQSDPSAFGSNYAREAAFTDMEWAERLWGTPGAKATFVAKVESTSLPSSEVKAQSQTDVSDTREGEGREGRVGYGCEEWVGCVTVLGPQAIQVISPDLYHSLQIAKAEQLAHYLVVAMWVKPNWRHQGIAKKLLGAALEWAKDDEGNRENSEPAAERSVKNMSEGSGCLPNEHSYTRSSDGNTGRAIHLQVHTNNEAARRLYEASGFQTVTPSDGVLAHRNDEQTELWMVHCC